MSCLLVIESEGKKQPIRRWGFTDFTLRMIERHRSILMAELLCQNDAGKTALGFLEHYITRETVIRRMDCMKKSKGDASTQRSGGKVRLKGELTITKTDKKKEAN